MALTRITKGVIKPNENYDTHNINSTGIVTAIGLDVNGNADISGDLNVGGVLTYEDVTSIDSVGIITAQQGIHVGAGISVVGVGTFGNIVVGAGGSIAVGTGITFETNGQGTFSGIATARIFDVGYSNGTISHGYFQAGRIKIFDNGSHLHFRGGDHPSYAPNQRYFSSVVERTNAYSLQNTAATRYGITWNNTDGPVHLYYSKGYAPDYSIKLSTTAKGITVGTGVTIETNGQATFSGITTFAGNINLIGELNTDTARIRLPDGMNGAPFTGNLELGNSRDFVMLHDGHHNYVKSTQNMYVFCGTNNLVTLQTGGSVLLNKDLDVDGHTNLDNVSISGVVTATSFVGDGSNLTSLPAQITFSNPSNNRILTSEGGIGVNCEPNLTFSGDTLTAHMSSATPALFVGDSNRTGAGQHLAEFRGYWDGNHVARIVYAAGDDTTNKDDGIITMHTTPSGGGITERLRITSDGKILINQTTSNWGTTTANSVIQLKNGVVWDYAGVQLDVGHNYYYNGSGAYKYIRGGYAARQTFHNNDGSIAFWSGGTGSADGTFTWDERLRILANGTVIFANKLTNSSSFTSHNANFYGGNVNTGGVRIELAHSTTTVSGNTASGAFPHNLLLSNYSGNGSADNRMCSIGFDIPTTGNHANATIAYQATGSNGVGDLQFWLENGNTVYERLRITSSGDIYTPAGGRLFLGGGGSPTNLAGVQYSKLLVDIGNNPDYVHFRKNLGQDQPILNITHNQDYMAAIRYANSGDAWASGVKSDGSYFFSHGMGATGGGGTERLHITSSGNVLIGDGSTYTPGSHVHLHGGTSGLQQLRVQNHTSVGSFTGNYGSEFRHAYSSANHCMLIHTQEAATARRVLDISDSNGIFASFTHHKMGLGTGITSPNGTLDIRTTDDDDAIRLVNTSTGNNGIQWWNEYGGLTKRVSMDYGEGDANFDIRCFRADGQDNRPYGNVRIMTGSYSNPTTNFRVTTLGSVHMPNQPSFSAADTAGHVYGSSSTPTMVFNNADFNVGNNYDTSNGIFTAPIAGKYQFSFCGMAAGGPGDFQVRITKNGGGYFNNNGSGRGYGTFEPYGFTVLMDLAINDEVQIKIYSSNTSAYIYAGQTWNRFSGYLIG